MSLSSSIISLRRRDFRLKKRRPVTSGCASGRSSAEMRELQPFEPVDLDIKIKFEMTREKNLLRVLYSLAGDLDQVRFPETVSHPARRDGLWKTTCFELFLSPKGTGQYWEFNFSPSGDWNCYRFDEYRAGMKEEKRITGPKIVFPKDAGACQLQGTITLSKVPELETELDISATAVIETMRGEQSFWALYHAGARPDFHLRGSFIEKI